MILAAAIPAATLPRLRTPTMVESQRTLVGKTPLSQSK
jgi:hypothetical protein